MMCKKRLRNPAITAIFAVSNFENSRQKFAPVTSHPGPRATSVRRRQSVVATADAAWRVSFGRV